MKNLISVIVVAVTYWNSRRIAAEFRRRGVWPLSHGQVHYQEGPGFLFVATELADLAAAETAVTAFAGYYNYHRLHGELDWQTPAERFDGTPFTDRGFRSAPALAGVADLLDAMVPV